MQQNPMGKNTDQYKVCFMGASLDTGNKGVSALCASFVKVMMEVKPNAIIKLLIGNRSTEPQQLQLLNKKIFLEIVNFRLSPKAKLEKNLIWIFSLACLQKILPIPSLQKSIIHSNPVLHEIKEADFIGDIRGGDSFSDIYGLKDLIISSLPAIVVILLGKKLVLLPQTFGPFKANLARKIGKYIISKAYKVCSRDLAGIDYVNELLGLQANRVAIIFCPDVAFTLDSIKPEEIIIQPPLDLKMRPSIIGVNVNGLMYHGGYTEKNMFGLKVDYKNLILHLLVKFLNETDEHLLLIPHTFGPSGGINSDPDASKKILSLIDKKFKSRIHMITSEHDQSGMKGIIGLCDFFIGSRMHACIAALSQHIPTIGIAYSKKFSGVFDSIGSKGTVLDARTLGEREIIEKVFVSYKNRDQLQKNIEGNISEAQQKISSVFLKLVS